jgi:hypothetical protein
LVKEKVERGTRKLFRTTVTDTSGNAQDPDSCQVRFEKIGYRSYKEHSQFYTCAKVGATGVWGANITTPDSMTLGDWVARFYWIKDNVPDNDGFEFTLVRKDRPWDSARGPVVP